MLFLKAKQKDGLGEEIAKWEIKVNGENIVGEEPKDFDLVFTLENEEDEKLMPGTEGSFEVALNVEHTEVSVRYDITIDDTVLDETDIKLKSVTEIEKATPLVRTGENTYTGLILLEDILDAGFLNRVKITLEWEVDENNPDINPDDIDALEIGLPITVKVTQYLDDEIVPYT